MRTFSSADTKNHFGELVNAARLASVAVIKYDKPFVVVMGIFELERMKAKEKSEKEAPGQKRSIARSSSILTR